MQFKYRKAELGDLSEVMRIYRGAQKFMEENNNPQWDRGFPDENDVRGGILGGVMYVVVTNEGRDGQIVAVFSATGYDGDYDNINGNWLTNDGNYLAVHRVAVDGGFRGTGAAKYILNFAAEEIAKSRGRSSIRMDTHEKNTPMRTLLISQGFSPCGTVTLIRDDTSRLAFEKIL